jgi:hypothetical protein
MTIHFDPRTASVLQPAVDTDTTLIEPPASSGTPHRPRKPRWAAPVALAIGAISVVGIAVLVFDTNSQSPSPSPAPAVVLTGTGTSQRLIQESIDGALAANDEGTSQRLVQNSIDAALATNGN